MVAELAGDPVFRHHQPVTAEAMEARLIPGMDGAYRARLKDDGYDLEGNKIYVSVVLLQDAQGGVQGSRLLKAGKVAAKEINSKDIWPEAPEAMVKILVFDLSDLTSEYGGMTSKFVELPFKVKVKEGAVWRTVKEDERAERGYGALSMKLYMWPKSIKGGEFMVVCVPRGLNELGELGGQVDTNSFPGIKIHKGHFEFSSPEAEKDKYGMGNMPFIVAAGVEWDEGVPVDVTNINWMSSMVMKKAVCDTLAEAVKPNYHHKRGPWDAAVHKGRFVKVAPSSVWPSPVMEDDQDTEVEEGDKSETEGEQGGMGIGGSGGCSIDRG
jgi:hypothetical protein